MISTSVSSLGTKARTGFLFGCFFFASSQTFFGSFPLATTLLPTMAMCFPLYFLLISSAFVT